MEHQVNLLALGQGSKDEVILENIEIFKEKFKEFESGLEKVGWILAPRPGQNGYDPNLRGVILLQIHTETMLQSISAVLKMHADTKTPGYRNT